MLGFGIVHVLNKKLTSWRRKEKKRKKASIQWHSNTIISHLWSHNMRYRIEKLYLKQVIVRVDYKKRHQNHSLLASMIKSWKTKFVSVFVHQPIRHEAWDGTQEKLLTANFQLTHSGQNTDCCQRQSPAISLLLSCSEQIYDILWKI